MTYEECLKTRHVLDQDRRFTGTVFSRKQWSTDHYSVSLQLRNGQEFEFNALTDFRNWHARYRLSRQARRQTTLLTARCATSCKEVFPVWDALGRREPNQDFSLGGRRRKPN